VADLLTLEQAQALVLARARPLPAERVPLADAAGRVIAAPVQASVDLPPFASSAMDGYAIRSADTPGRLPIVARIAAGRPATRALTAGEAMEISTGGVVPAGADAVIPIEYVVQLDNETIEIATVVEAGANVRPRGGDIGAGDVVVPAGTLLGPGQLGAIAASGVAEVDCARRPRIVVLATGTELARPGVPLEPGQVYEANGLMLAAALAAAGAEVERLPAVADDEDAHRAAIARGLEADVLVTSGGVSVGPHDLVRMVEAELGVEEVFWRVAIRPGKPVSFGVRARVGSNERDGPSTLVFGLPGNPVSSLVGCELFVKPAVLALQGAADPLPPLDEGVLTAALRRNEARDDFVRARVRFGAHGAELEPIVGQESHMIARSAAANGLVHVPRGEGELAAGSRAGWLRL
jgi:molybdopterin molybdotransferase